MTVRADRDFAPAAWLRSAEQHAGDARLLARKRDAAQPRHGCFFAGAAARFAVRALLLALDRDTRESDDLAELIGFLPAEAASIKEHPSGALLARYGPEIEYPDGAIPGLTWADAEQAASSAEAFVTAIRAELEKRGTDLTVPGSDGGR